MNRTELVDIIARMEPTSDVVTATETMNKMISYAREIVIPEPRGLRVAGRAVRHLRHALGDSQQMFTVRMGLAVRTIVRYEATEPTGKVLARFEQLARESSQTILADIFRRALYGYPEES